jgi:tetratricopeptide (TPR) repeat protein
MKNSRRSLTLCGVFVLLALSGATAMPSAAQTPKKASQKKKKPPQVGAQAKQKPPRAYVGMRDQITDPGVIARTNRQLEILDEVKQLVKTSQWAAVEKRVREGVAVEPRNAPPDFNFALGQALEGQGRDKEAWEPMQQAFFGPWKGMESQPVEVVHYALLAERLGKKAEARAAFLQAAKAGLEKEYILGLNAPVNPTERQLLAIAWTAVGMEQNRRDGAKAAMDSFRKALTYDPKCIIAHLEIGKKLPRDGEEALFHFQQAAKSKHENTRRFAELEVQEIQSRIQVKARKEAQERAANQPG